MAISQWLLLAKGAWRTLGSGSETPDVPCDTLCGAGQLRLGRATRLRSHSGRVHSRGWYRWMRECW